MVTMIKKLYEFADCLSIGKLEFLSRNIQNINLELDQVIAKNKEKKMTSEETQQITELHQKLEKTEGTIEEIPIIVERLENLKELHEESAGLALNLSTLKNSQQFMRAILDENSDVLKQLETNFLKNIEILNKNLGILEQRFGNITKKK